MTGPSPSTEAVVGITAYASPSLPGFHAILKHRFTDFVVSELHVPADGSRAPRPVGLPAVYDAAAAASAVDAASRAAWVAEDAALVSAAVANGGGEASDGGAADDGRAAPSTLTPLAASIATLARLTTPAAADAVHDLITAILGGVAPPPPPVDLPPIGDKAARTGLHAWGRATAGALGLGGRLETLTQAGGVVRVVVWPPGGGGGGGRGERGGGRGGGRDVGRGGGKRGREEGGAAPTPPAPTRDPRTNRDASWPGGRGAPYCHFTLVKANMETGAALAALARAAGNARPDAFTFAGTKDKRGVTAQRVAARRLAAPAIAAAARRAGGPGGRLRVGAFSYEPHPLHLGDAAGNEFRLALRGVAPSDARAADVAVACLDTAAGFINYFGLQRFGTGGAPTHAIGAALALGEWERAVRLIMAPRGGGGGGGGGGGHGESGGGETGDAARLAWAAGTATAAATAAALPRAAVAERALLASLARPGTGASDFASALGALPRALKSLYTHALQAAVWNAAASARAAAATAGGGCAPGAAGPVLEGDLVIEGGAGTAGLEEEEEVEDEGEQMATGAGASAPPPSAGPRPLPAVRALTRADVEAGSYTAADIVIPLPGRETWPPPPGPAADAARDAGKRLGVDLDATLSSGPSQKQQHRAAWLPGARGGYRHLFHVPVGGVAHAWVAHAGPDEDLLAPEEGGGAEGRRGVGPLTPAAVPWAPGSPLPPGTTAVALVLRFSLPPSGYATMLVRELTKQSTAAPPPPVKEEGEKAGN